MEIDSDKLLAQALRDGIREAVKSKLSSNYNNPLDTVITEALKKHAPAFSSLIGECVASCLSDQDFRGEIIGAVRKTLAKTLVARFGGELEKQVNVLKSDPATRARITLAIEEIVKSRITT